MQPFRGIALKLCAVLCFITMSSLIKAASDQVPPGESVFFRGFFALPVILVWIASRGPLREGISVKAPMAHVWRGFIGTCAMASGFAGLALLPLPEVTALSYAAPLLTVIFAAMFLNERVGVFRISTVAIGLAGVILILAPRLTALTGDTVQTAEAAGAVIVILGAVCAALAQIHIRNMVQTEQTTAIVFWFTCTSIGLSLLTVPFGWRFPDWPEVSFLILAGLLGGAGQICLTSAYRYADASLVAPFDYASMLFAILIGYFVFQEVPTGRMLLGAAIIVSAGVAIILRERHLGIQRNRAKEARTL